jgi:mannose/fructose-specific phosphotransferase system component IIA
MQFSPSDINTESISVVLVDSWAASILPAITEMIDRLNSHNFLLRDVNISVMKGEVSKDALEARIAELLKKLLESEKKERQTSSMLQQQSKSLTIFL